MFGECFEKHVPKVKINPVTIQHKEYTGCISVFPNIFTTSNPKYMEIEDVIERIKNGNSKDLVERIRNGENVKSQLPSICFSGIFPQRNNASLIKHSGYVVLDYDNLKDVQAFKKYICKSEYVRCAFVSPSGKGLKVVVKIKGDHKDMCEKLGNYFPKEGLDLQTDVSRVCYESFDPEIFYNANSLIYG